MKKNNYLIPQNNFIFIFVMMVLSLIYFLYIPRYVPAYFTQDSFTVKNAMLDPGSFEQSYRNTAAFYKLFGFSYTSVPLSAHFFAWIIFAVWLATLLRINRQKSFSMYEGAFIGFVALMYGIEYTTLTKDLLLILFMVVIVNVYIRHRSMFVLAVATLIYAYFFRTYWYMVASWAAILGLQKNPKIRKGLTLLLLFSLAVIVVYNLSTGGQITTQRVDVNATRDSTAAASMLNNVIPNSNIFTDIVNWIYTMGTLIVPLQGLGSPNVIVYYIWIWAVIAFCIKHRQQIDSKTMLLLVGFVAVQAMFEPDLGSALRHQLPWCPLLYFLLEMNEKPKQGDPPA